MGAVIDRYRAALAERGYQADSAQLAAIERLQRLADELEGFDNRPNGNVFKRLLGRGKQPAPKGVWMYGGVGRGKSFLMDCFYQALPTGRKTRMHFHEFMRAVHHELKGLKAMADPLDEVARRAAERYQIICFDEFHLSDIADAMILERLLNAFFRHRLVFVMTSNYVPDGLYPDGLHRDSVLPAIALLNANLDVLSVDVGTDYRQLTIKGVPAYLSPLTPEQAARMSRAFEQLAAAHETSPDLLIENRPIRALRCAQDVVWFDFDTLCRSARSQNDYLEIATRFETVMLSDVPQMNAGMASEARRFTWLIDVLYDQKVNLIMSAEVPPEQLYVSGVMAHEFVRTTSRLHEMQSDSYRNEQRRGRVDRLG
ncbi:MAG: cell division protein ZapE [Lautropia sp.]|nr:cell division protein ZapE [Lautropia sp.]